MKKRRWGGRILAFWMAAMLLIMTGMPALAADVTFSLDQTSLAFGSLLSARTATVRDSGGVLATTKGNNAKGTLSWSNTAAANRPLFASGTASLVYTPYSGTKKTGSVSYTVSAPTSATMRNAVNALSASDQVGIDGVSAALSRLTTAEKKKLPAATIRKLGEYYNKIHAISSNGRDKVRVSSNVSYNKTIDASDSYAYGVSASAGRSASLSVSQKAVSGSAIANMDLSGFYGPVVVYLAAPDGWGIVSSRDYYVTTPSGNRTANVTGSNPRYIYFTAPVTGTYKLYKGSVSDNDDDDDDDRSSFWDDVMDGIRDADIGDRIRVSMGSRNSVPADVLRVLRGRSVTIVLRKDGKTVTIYGKDIPKIPESRSSYSFSTLKNLYGDHSSSSSKPSSSGASSSKRPDASSSTAGTQWIIDTPPAASAAAPTAPAIPSVALPPAPLPSSPIAPSTVSSPEDEEDLFSDADEVYEPRQHEDLPPIEEPVDDPESADQLSASLPDNPPEVQADGRETNLLKMFVFMGLVVLTAALGGGLLTYTILVRHKRQK